MHQSTRNPLRSNLVPLMPVDEVDFLNDSHTSAGQTGPSSETIARWLSAAGRLHRSTAGSPEYYADAARFAVEVVGLDAAWVLTRCGEDWKVAGSYPSNLEEEVVFDNDRLHFLERELVAWYQPRSTEVDETYAAPPQTVVVAPVLDCQGHLVAAIYGTRNTDGENRRRGVRPSEARLVQLLAESVSVGIARMDRETEAARTRVLLEQTFSPTVAQYIQEHPDRLAGQLREATLLFADLCDFTSLAELLSPTDCCDLLGSVRELLTEVVVARQGVVVDYYGDGLLAMWNAPLEQTDHAVLACLAAQEMLDCLPSASERWRDRLQEPLQLGIGLHTGQALVGNAGTRSRIKYGPRGNAVNVASRVQAASKQLQLPLVMTKATHDKLSDEFLGQRICTAKLSGLEEELDLYTVYLACNESQLREQLDRYAEALHWYEAGNLVTAERLLTDLAAQGDMLPARFLADHTAAQLQAVHRRRFSDQSAFSQGPVIELAGK